MARLKPIDRSAMNEAQAEILDEIDAAGGRISGPYTAYIRTPRFMKLHQEASDYFRNCSLRPRERELIVLLTVRHGGARYAWGINAQIFLDAGMDRALVDAINAREFPPVIDEDEKTVCQVVLELLERNSLSDESYAAAIGKLGEERLVDLVAAVGFYSSIALVLNTFHVDPPAGLPVPLNDETVVISDM